jgi:hypothetical protein
MTNSNISATIDAYAIICAKITELEKQKAAVKKTLDFLDVGAHEGDKFTLTVSESERNTLDMEAVREKLSRQFIQANTTTTQVRSFRTKARVLVEG